MKNNFFKKKLFTVTYLGERRKVENLTGKIHGSSRKNSNFKQRWKWKMGKGGGPRKMLILDNGATKY